MTCRSQVRTLVLLFLIFLTSALISCATSQELNPTMQNEFKNLFDPNKTYQYFHKAKEYPFLPEARSLNKVNMAWLADAVMLAYCDSGFVKEKLGKVGFDRTFHSINNKGTQGFITSNKEVIFVIFRGTEINETKDLLYDANFLPTAEGNGLVHNGFRDALDAVWVEVEKRLKDMTKLGNQSVWFTGHSLGGAIASLAAGRWKANPSHSQQMVSLYTFGAPGVGNKDYVKDYPDVSVVRVIDNEDQVANTERKGIILDLRHPGGVTIKFERPSKMLTEKKHDKLPDLLADHAPIYYAENSWRQVMSE